MVKYLARTENMDSSYYVWRDFSSRTSYMLTQLSGGTTGFKFIEFFRPAITAQFLEFGFVPKETDSHIKK
jgi:hypothetical protein